MNPRSLATTHMTESQTRTTTLISKLRDYYILTKPEVNLLILMTTSAGYYEEDVRNGPESHHEDESLPTQEIEARQLLGPPANYSDRLVAEADLPSV